AAFVDREFYMRSNGQVRFLTVSRRLQLLAAGSIATILLTWLTISGVMLIAQADANADRLAMAEEAERVAATAAAVDDIREGVEARARRLTARQDFLDTLAEDYFGETPAAGSLEAVNEKVVAPAVDDTEGNDSAALAAIPAATDLARLEARQLAFASGVASLAEARVARAEREMKRLGLNPKRFIDNSAKGGPFVPFGATKADLPQTPFADLTVAMDRLDRLERALVAVPSFSPAKNSRLTSRFGFRYDPFRGTPARHQGQDFAGAHGEPILAAGPGKVVRAARWAGYGKAVEIDHGRGIRTRYAHMSKLDVKVGDRVERGQQVGRMGSTGRSTGTHLHFEVRIDGKAVNPRPFLEANDHVLEIQTVAGRRLHAAHAG
ncbi:MAG: M23 family metallopeptidase, partial [Pseudomonadota bacterium]